MVPTAGRNWIFLAAVRLTSLMSGPKIFSLATISSTLEKVLPGKLQQLQWMTNADTIAVTAVLTTTGTLVDRYGGKRIFVGSLIMLGLASLVCGLARDAAILIISRFRREVSGLLLIGLSFMLVWVGNRVDHPSWLTPLPRCLFACIGLGLISTPVANTRTGLVSSTRVSMASGDTNTRRISLSINIAPMGSILIAGIPVWLRNAAPAAFNAARLQILTERITGGNIVVSDVPELQSLPSPGATVHGFGPIMLYGDISVRIFSLLNFVIFGKKARCRGLPLASRA